MKRPKPPVQAFLAVTAVLILGAGTSAAVGPPSAVVAPATNHAPVPVVRAGAVCPEPFPGTGAQTQVGLAAPGRDGAAGRSGQAQVLRLSGSDAPLVSLVAPAQQAAAAVPAGSPALVGEATDDLAPGFAAMEATRTPSGELRGLAGTTCVPAGTDFWFVGSGAEVGQRGRLYLTNPESAPAQVDVTLYGPAGQIEAPSGRGVSVAARGQEVLLLDALAPAVPRFGVHVQVRQGRVAAALRDQQIRGLDPLGIDWVPPSAPPARRVVLAGVPAGSGERRLQVLAPGTADAVVRVRLLGANGAFVPAGLDVLEVPAGTVGDVDLAPHTRGEAVAVELTSDTPVTAGLLARVGTGKEQPELAYVAANSPLIQKQPAVLPLAAVEGSAGAQLLLTAPRGVGSVRVTPLPPATGTSSTVSVPDGTQVAVDLRGISTAPTFAVTVVPLSGSAPVFASRLLTGSDSRGPMVTLSTLLPGRYVVAVPEVSADLSTGLRSGP
jgi:hypothetical protein